MHFVRVGGEGEDARSSLLVAFELTGRTGTEPDNVRSEGTSWGQMFTGIGAPALGALEVGDVRLENPTVWYRPEQPNFVGAWPIYAQGLMGNAPFWDEVVVLDLGIWNSFGVLR